ncbi:hypothetical protein [Ancylobacter lacus]|uniref:hypothetical protein n=1 Tax=Ancylobacter lacus TaxID=2579970 RepID=UPI001BCEB0CB|nr:hypothetical protein [Ancylobacter lacus]MBS7539370.1 hypothetical protein [Ancylobacter lacus]
MSIPARAVSPDAVEEARRLYEHTSVPVQQIADLLGICKSTLNLRIRHWGWTRRVHRIPPAQAGAPAVPGGVSANPAGADPGAAGPAAPASAGSAGCPAAPAAGPERLADPATSRRDLVARLVKRIEGEIAAVERLIARAGLNAGAVRVADAERAARTLGLLVRSLRELAALERAEGPEEDEDADEVRDVDSYRRELARALERVLAEREAG